MKYRIGTRVQLVRPTSESPRTVIRQPVGSLGTVLMPFRGPEDVFVYRIEFDDTVVEIVPEDALALVAPLEEIAGAANG